jgi:hypothetical protein
LFYILITAKLLKYRKEVIKMCGESKIKCEVKVTELKDGYQVQITGSDAKDALKPENLKKCIQACCSEEPPFKDSCCR